MSRGHSHACTRCKQPFGCSGELLRNFDGFPEVVCDLFHHQGGHFTECETCVMTSWCSHCGAKPAAVEHDGDQVCLTCASASAPAQRKRA